MLRCMLATFFKMSSFHFVKVFNRYSSSNILEPLNMNIMQISIKCILHRCVILIYTLIRNKRLCIKAYLRLSNLNSLQADMRFYKFLHYSFFSCIIIKFINEYYHNNSYLKLHWIKNQFLVFIQNFNL